MTEPAAASPGPSRHASAADRAPGCPVCSGRRRVLGAIGHLATAAALAPLAACSGIIGERRLPTPLRGANTGTVLLTYRPTGETTDVAYKQGERYLPEALEQIDRLLRDRTADRVAVIDVRLVDLVSDLQAHFGRRPVEVLSGFRTEVTNAKIRRSNGLAARNSLHIRGQALDLRIPGVPTREVYETAVAFQRGGVGTYAGESFVHVDTGPVRVWS